MDEGSIATMPQFHEYAKRLLNIFDVNYPFAVRVPNNIMSNHNFLFPKLPPPTHLSEYCNALYFLTANLATR